MNSPASLAEGMKRCPVDIEGKGAGGGLGIQPQCELHKTKVFLSFIMYSFVLCFFLFSFIPFVVRDRMYHPAPVPPPLLTGEAGELKLPSTLKT